MRPRLRYSCSVGMPPMKRKLHQSQRQKWEKADQGRARLCSHMHLDLQAGRVFGSCSTQPALCEAGGLRLPEGIPSLRLKLAAHLFPSTGPISPSCFDLLVPQSPLKLRKRTWNLFHPKLTSLFISLSPLHTTWPLPSSEPEGEASLSLLAPPLRW